MLYRLYVNINMSVGGILVCNVAIRSANSSSLRMLGYPSKQVAILTYKGPLKSSALAILSFLLAIWWCR
jgi:hypothetical protein